ncbi:MAG: UDP-N-acetylmuramate--L-alanine ligase, partial [Ferrovum sp.]|nr:UDP-N-acetylmuramate--L-alanine ligase [Ferrovum sp.]
RALVGQVGRPVRTYGFGPEAQIRAVDVRAEAGGMRFGVELRLARDGILERRLEVTLALPGRHNVLNALAAIAVAIEVNAAYPAIVRALASFKGVGRRFQRYGDLPLPQGGFITLVDDYGHHPAEMAATLEAARGVFPGRRLVLAFQPHRYTRTRDRFSEFVRVLGGVEQVVLAPVYAAGETPLPGVDSLALAQALAQKDVVVAEGMDVMGDRVLERVRAGDVVITMGAGNISQLPGQLCERLGGGSHT